jgi:hypothetical protein
LSKDPWQRPASGAELAAMLEPIASHPTTRFPTHAPPLPRAKKPLRLVTAWALGAASALVALGATHLAQSRVPAAGTIAASPICPTLPVDLSPLDRSTETTAPAALPAQGGTTEPNREVETTSPSEGPTDLGPPSEVQRDKTLAPMETSHSALRPGSPHSNEKL